MKNEGEKEGKECRRGGEGGEVCGGVMCLTTPVSLLSRQVKPESFINSLGAELLSSVFDPLQLLVRDVGSGVRFGLILSLLTSSFRGRHRSPSVLVSTFHQPSSFLLLLQV